MKPVLGVDVGGTNIRMALITPAGDIVAQQRENLNLAACGHSAEQIIETLVQCLQPLASQAASIGMGFPGFFHGQTGVLAASPNLPALNEVPLAEILAQRLTCDVQVQNDALCAALGEFHFGAAKALDSVLHITLGTGVGGGLIMNGRPLYGEGGMACEFGHLCIDTTRDAHVCPCGKQGCVEAYASATAISRMYQQARGESLSAFEIYQQACQGAPDAEAVFKQAGHAIGRAIAEVVKLLDMRHITISGGVTGAWVLLHPAIIEAVEQHVIPPQREKTSIVMSNLEDQGGILGAASMAMGLG
jgi:glucokinase